MKEQAQCEPAAEAVEHKQPASPAPTEPDTNHTHRIKTSYGAGLAASRPLSAGSLVLTLDAPHLLLVEKDSLARVCSFCMREAPTVKRCSACKTPHYCGKACQHGHWRAHHGRECGLLKKLPEVPPTAVRALMAMLVSREKGTRGGEEGDWKGLESHVGRWQRDGERWEEMLWQARAGIEFTQSGPERMEEAIAYLGVLSTNAFRVTREDNTPVGMCLSPTLARANHSCKPNAFVVFDSRRISLRSLEPIKKDEQIFVSYIDPTEGLRARQSRLAERYFFTCTCNRCQKDENPYEALLSSQAEHGKGSSDRRMEMFRPRHEIWKMAQQVTTALQQSALLKQSQGQTRTAAALLAASRTLRESPKDSRISVLTRAVAVLEPRTTAHMHAMAPYPDVLHELYLACIDAAAFVSALITLLYLFLNADVVVYPQPHHPVRVVRLFTIAKLLKHVTSLSPTELLQDISRGDAMPRKEDAQAKEEIAKAVQGTDLIGAFHTVMILVWELARKSHGEGSRFVEEVEQEIREVGEVQRMRGPAGAGLEKWMGDVGDVEGGVKAQKCFAELRALAGLSGKVFSSLSSRAV